MMMRRTFVIESVIVAALGVSVAILGYFSGLPRLIARSPISSGSN